MALPKQTSIEVVVNVGALEDLRDAMGYARDRKLDCRREAAGSASASYEIGMADAFAEMSEYIYGLLEARLAAAAPTKGTE